MNQEKGKKQDVATVVSRFGNKADIRLIDGNIIRCHIRRALSHLVCGDEVDVEIQKGQGVVTRIHPRHTILERVVPYEGLKPVAANIDQMVIVTAILPEFSSLLLDRYLALSEHLRIPAVIVFNKIDLLSESELESFRSQTNLYHELGYTCLYCSVKGDQGIAELREMLNEHRSIFVGQSGVGKSSLLNLYLPDEELLTGEVSDNSGLGTHTTTVSRLYTLTCGGEVIDSPGIRDFSLEHLSKEAIAAGFKEINEHADNCRFRNCQHLKEPKCAVKLAVEQGEIASERYQNYCQILNA